MGRKILGLFFLVLGMFLIWASYQVFIDLSPKYPNLSTLDKMSILTSILAFPGIFCLLFFAKLFFGASIRKIGAITLFLYSLVIALFFPTLLGLRGGLGFFAALVPGVIGYICYLVINRKSSNSNY